MSPCAGTPSRCSACPRSRWWSQPPCTAARPLRALSENWPLLLTSYLPTLALMIVLYNLTEECGFTGFLFARLQDQHGPLRAALLTTICFWWFHLPTFVIDTGSWALAAIIMGVVLLPHLASRLIVGWLYNASGASVLIAGLFHATFNSTINPSGFAVAVLEPPTRRSVRAPDGDPRGRRSRRRRRDQRATRSPTPAGGAIRCAALRVSLQQIPPLSGARGTSAAGRRLVVIPGRRAPAHDQPPPLNRPIERPRDPPVAGDRARIELADCSPPTRRRAFHVPAVRLLGQVAP